MKANIKDLFDEYSKNEYKKLETLKTQLSKLSQHYTEPGDDNDSILAVYWAASGGHTDLSNVYKQSLKNNTSTISAEKKDAIDRFLIQIESCVKTQDIQKLLNSQRVNYFDIDLLNELLKNHSVETYPELKLIMAGVYHMGSRRDYKEIKFSKQDPNKLMHEESILVCHYFQHFAAKCYMDYFNSQSCSEKHKETILKSLKVLALNDALNNTWLASYALGNYHSTNSNFEKAEEFLLKSIQSMEQFRKKYPDAKANTLFANDARLKLATIFINDPEKLIQAAEQLYLCYIDKNSSEEARESSLEQLQSPRINKPHSKKQIAYYVARCYEHDNNIESLLGAKDLYQILQKDNNQLKASFERVLINLGKLYSEKNKTEEAVESYNQARAYLESAKLLLIAKSDPKRIRHAITEHINIIIARLNKNQNIEKPDDDSSNGYDKYKIDESKEFMKFINNYSKHLNAESVVNEFNESVKIYRDYLVERIYNLAISETTKFDQLKYFLVYLNDLIITVGGPENSLAYHTSIEIIVASEFNRFKKLYIDNHNKALIHYANIIGLDLKFDSRFVESRRALILFYILQNNLVKKIKDETITKFLKPLAQTNLLAQKIMIICRGKKWLANNENTPSLLAASIETLSGSLTKLNSEDMQSKRKLLEDFTCLARYETNVNVRTILKELFEVLKNSTGFSNFKEEVEESLRVLQDTMVPDKDNTVFDLYTQFIHPVLHGISPEADPVFGYNQDYNTENNLREDDSSVYPNDDLKLLSQLNQSEQFPKSESIGLNPKSYSTGTYETLPLNLISSPGYDNVAESNNAETQLHKIEKAITSASIGTQTDDEKNPVLLNNSSLENEKTSKNLASIIIKARNSSPIFARTPTDNCEEELKTISEANKEIDDAQAFINEEGPNEIARLLVLIDQIKKQLVDSPTVIEKAAKKISVAKTKIIEKNFYKLPKIDSELYSKENRLKSARKLVDDEKYQPPKLSWDA